MSSMSVFRVENLLRDPPIHQLTDLESISHDGFRSESVVLNSGGFVVFLHGLSDSSSARGLTIVNALAPNDDPTVLQHVVCDHAIMNPFPNCSSIIALRKYRQLQIFDLQMKARVSKTVFDRDFGDIQFWTWIGPTTLGLVASDAVYHWDIEFENEHAEDACGTMTKIFDRHTSMRDAACVVIDYRTDESMTWCLLLGRERRVPEDVESQQVPGEQGRMQLYSVEKAVSQPIRGEAGNFFNLGDIPVIGLVSIEQQQQQRAKLYLLPLPSMEHSSSSNFAQRKIEIEFGGSADSPICLFGGGEDEVGSYPLVYVLTKQAWLYIFDLTTGLFLAKKQLFEEDNELAAAEAVVSKTGKVWIVGVTDDENGRVFRVGVDEVSLVEFLMATGEESKVEIAQEISSRKSYQQQQQQQQQEEEKEEEEEREGEEGEEEILMMKTQHDLDLQFMQEAISEARLGRSEGGIPIGAVLVHRPPKPAFALPKIIGRGHNQRIQKSSPILHGETDCLENAGRLPAKIYSHCTMYSTLSPCDMCTGTILLFKIPRVVIGENETFRGPEEYSRSRGVEVVNLDLVECKEMMGEFIREHPDVWDEDIGEEHETEGENGEEEQQVAGDEDIFGGGDQ